MHSHALRRVFKPFSSKKDCHANGPASSSHSPTMTRTTQSHVHTTENLSSVHMQDPALAAAAAYDCYRSRLSQISPLNVQTDVSPTSFHFGDSPTNSPPSPSTMQRSISRAHRHAVRDLTLPLQSLVVQRESGFMDTEDKENSSRLSNSSSDHPNMPFFCFRNPHLDFTSLIPVGKGGTGEVYFANSLHDPTHRVAMKRVTPNTEAKEAALQNELRTMRALQHPNILSCHAAYRHEGQVWIVMEAMDVGCLTHVLDFLRTKAYLLSEAHIAYILRETLSGLWEMHSSRCMHRDIKSDNVLVNSNGEIKLGDFEYTAVLTEEIPKRKTVVGTAWWMSPETARSSYYDYGADVWSIGILSIECAEWVPPLFGVDSDAAIKLIGEGRPQGFQRPDIWSVEFADFVRGCLVKDRNVRYSVQDLLEHPFLVKACSRVQMANVFRAVRGIPPLDDDTPMS